MTRSRYREPCARVLEAVSKNQADGRTSVAVLEEIWHLEPRGALGDLTGLAADVRALFAPVLPVTDVVPTILSADVGFDDVKRLRRVDPLDEKGLRRLLAT